MDYSIDDVLEKFKKDKFLVVTEEFGYNVFSDKSLTYQPQSMKIFKKGNYILVLDQYELLDDQIKLLIISNNCLVI